MSFDPISQSTAVPVDNTSPVGSDSSAVGGTGALADSNSSAVERRTLIRRIVTGSLAVVLLWFFTGRPQPSPVFIYHPTSFTLAALALLPEAISVAMAAKAAVSMNKRGESVQVHALVSAAMKATALAGYASIYRYKVERGKSHFTSFHGKLGLISGLLLVAQVVLGIVQFWAVPGVSSQARALCRKLHRWLGSALALSFAATFATGFNSNWAIGIFAGQDLLRLLAGASCFAACAWAFFKE